MTETMKRRAQAAILAERTEDAYSANRYGSWQEVARRLLRMGFSEAEAEAVMRSKITRWAADASNARYGKVPAKVVEDYILNDEARRGYRVHEEIAEWAKAYKPAP